MALVIGLTLVMAVVVGATLAYATNLRPQVVRNASWNAAMAAAQAGVDDYVAQLNRKDNYWIDVDCANQALKGPRAGSNSCGWNSSTQAGWVNVQNGVPSAGAFHYDVDAGSFWKDGSIWVESTGKVDDVSRTIQVRVSRGGSTDFLYYTDFEDSDPANFVAYPPGGSKSLASGGAKYDECGKSGASVASYWWTDRSGGQSYGNNYRATNNYCQEIQFAKSDVLDGAVHFNDSPLMSNSGSGSGVRPTFLQGYQTADPRCTRALGKADGSGVGTNAGKGNCWRSASTTNPYVGNAGAIPASPLYLPDNSDKFAGFPGCHYYGDTRIRFKNDGTMDVWNTSSSGQSLLNPTTPAGTNCGNAASFVPASGQKHPATKQNVPVPNDMVIYVTAATTGSATCVPGQVVNGTTSGSTSNDVIPQGGGPTGTGVADVSYYNPSSVSTATSKTYRKINSTTWQQQGSTTGPSATLTGDVHPTTFDCGLGNVYVEGSIKGRVTIAAQNNIIVTNDLTVASTPTGSAPVGPDMSGLVAANSVVVYHPVKRNGSAGTTALTKNPTNSSATCPNVSPNTPQGAASSSALPTGGSSGNTVTCTWTQGYTYNTDSASYTNLSFPGATSSTGTRWIYTSIQTLAHSFWVQSYNLGADLGKLSVRGSIAQKWRGAVGTSGGTGFDKDYSYDTRLQFASPPYFPQWTNAVWGAKTTGELEPRY